MIERKELNTLVIATLSSSGSLKANQLYTEIRETNEGILRKEHIRSFRSFVKCINMFPDVGKKNVGTKVYFIK